MKTLLAEGWLENGGRSVAAVVVVVAAVVDSADDVESSEASVIS